LEKAIRSESFCWNLEKSKNKMMKYKTIYCVLILVLTLSCASTEKKAEQVIPEVKMPPPVITKSGLEEIPLVQLEEPQKPPERLYSIATRDSDIKSLLMSFSKDSEYNIILDPDVSGTVTMDLKRVTLEEALDAILTPLGYVYQKQANMIKVFRPTPETRIFTLNYLATVRTGTASVKAKTPGGVEKEDEVAAEVISTEKADIWDEIEKGLKQLLSEDGKFLTNKMASIIVVTDYPANLEKVAEFLEAIEGTIQRQVLIEARIIEVTLSDDYQMGLNWERILGGGRGTMDQTSFAPVSDAITGQTGVFQFAFNYNHVTGLLHAMAAQGKVNIISKPRITTMNNQRAIIKVGTEDVYFKVEEDEGTTGKTTYTYTPEFFTIGVVLDVTPQIGPGDELTLHIHPVITEKVDEEEYPFGGGTGTVPTVPIVSIRESSSVVRVKSGQTLVLAGLLMKKNSETIVGIPGLMNIPFLGSLFRYKKIETEKTELVVTLTPRILVGQGIDDFSDDELTKLLGNNGSHMP